MSARLTTARSVKIRRREARKGERDGRRERVLGAGDYIRLPLATTSTIGHAPGARVIMARASLSLGLYICVYIWIDVRCIESESSPRIPIYASRLYIRGVIGVYSGVGLIKSFDLYCRRSRVVVVRILSFTRGCMLARARVLTKARNFARIIKLEIQLYNIEQEALHLRPE